MLFVIPGFLLLGLFCMAIWAFFFRAVLRQEYTVREARKRYADFARLLATPSEPLFCVACRELFAGPLTAQGCPSCNVGAFVIPARASDDPKVAAQAVRAIPLAEDAPSEISDPVLHHNPGTHIAVTPSPEPIRQRKNPL